MKPNHYTEIGVLLFAIMSIIDRNFITLKDYIYIPIALLSLFLMIISMVKSNNRK